ncbi:MAG TPA: NAD(P)/FAD-dependent oxidoreductase, partial [Micromonospora sp.]
MVDVIVLGMGVAGEEAAGHLAEAGLTVLGIENQLVGGECPFWGCIPSKMMIRAANAVAEARRVNELAGHVTMDFDWALVARRIREEATDNWDDTVGVRRFTDKGGRFVRGFGRFVGPRRIEAGGEVFEARVGIVVSTGTKAAVPPIEGLAGTPYWTNREAIELEELPRSLIVLGGGSIGVELGQMFSRFGVEVTLVEALDRLVALEEPESSELVTAALRADGAKVHTGVRVERVEHGPDGFRVHLADGPPLTAEKVRVAAGRRAQLDHLGLEAAGLDPHQRFLPVDDRMRVTDGIWAAGDVTGHGAFTHVAIYQARIVVRGILGQTDLPCPPEVVCEMAGGAASRELAGGELAKAPAGTDLLTPPGGSGRA